MQDTNTIITWPTKLKAGTKSKKDPHIRIVGDPEEIASAREKILDILDSRKNRVTLKMDVAYTDHSHIIGKGGRSIQKVMNDTGCHIHFPDSNRTNTVDKSNQVSIAGTPLGAEQARCRIRELLPLSVYFELPVSNFKMDLFDHSSPAIQNITQTFNIAINIRVINKHTAIFSGFAPSYSTYAIISVRGTRASSLPMKQGIMCLIEYLCGQTTTPIVFTLVIDIASQHHSFVMGRGNCNIRTIMQQTGVVINFPDVSVDNSANTLHGSLTIRKSTVLVKAPCFDSVVCAWQELLGYLPLVLIFDLKEGQQTDAALITQLMKDFEVSILIKQKPKQNSGRCITVRGSERDSRSLFEVRRQILELDESEVPACCNKHTFMMMAKLFSSILPQCGLNQGNFVALRNNFPQRGLPSTSPLVNPVNCVNWAGSQGNLDAVLAASNQMKAPDTGFLQLLMASQMPNLTSPQISNQFANLNGSDLFGSRDLSGYVFRHLRKNNFLTRGSLFRNKEYASESRENSYQQYSQVNTPYGSQYGPGSGSPHVESPESRVSTTSAPSPLDLSPPPTRSLSSLFSNMDCNNEKTQLFGWSDDKKSDYDEKRYLAAKVIRDSKTKSSEPRTPTPFWAGLGFSKSMPHEVLKARLESCRALAPVEEVPSEFNDSASVWDASSSNQYPTGKVSQSTGRFLRKQQSLDIPSIPSSYSLTPSLSSSSSLFSNHSDTSSSSSFNPLPGSKSSSFDYGSPTKNVDLVEILFGIGLAKYVDYFQSVDIDFNTFLNLNDADLEELGIPYFGRRKISCAIADLKRALRDHDQLYHFEAAPGAERKQRAVKRI